MGMKINNLNVDEAYSPVVEKALFEDTVLIPGLTYNDQFTEIAGKEYVHKETTKERTPGKVGSDFTEEDANDELVAIEVNQKFDFDKKIYGVQMNTVKYDVVASQMDVGTKEIRSAKQKVGLAWMCKHGTDFGDYTKITDSNIRSICTQLRKKVKDNKAQLDYYIVNTSVYACMLADKTAFVPATNDEQIRTGIVGRYLGAPVLEANALQGTIQPYEWVEAFDLSTVDIIAGQTDGLAIKDILNALRVVQAIKFVGVHAQGEVDSGYMVANSNKIVVKYNKQPSA